jgi:chorismate synthase
LLEAFSVRCVGFVAELFDVKADVPWNAAPEALAAARDANEVYCPDPAAVDAMIAAIRQAKVDKDTVGGIVETRVYGLPVGLGSCFTGHERLDGRLMQAVGSIQAFKGAEIGLGFEAARRRGSQVHDPIHFDAARRDEPGFGFTRPRNHAGGLEGGMTNGEPLVVRGTMKPISTLAKPLASVDFKSKEVSLAAYERSDTCAIVACAVIAEAEVALVLADAALEAFGGDTLADFTGAFRARVGRYAEA